MEKFLPSFPLRVQRSADVLSVSPETLLKALETAGIDEAHASVLDSPTVTVEDLIEVLNGLSDVTIPKLLLKAAAGHLKGMSQIGTLGIGVPGTYTTSTETAYYPVPQQGTSDYLVTSQMPDRELLNKFNRHRDSQSYEELYRRSKDQPFIVLQQIKVDVGEHEYVAPGRELIDIDRSLDFLKASRKKGTSLYMVSDDSSDALIPIYRVSEIWMGNRVVHLCPICDAALCRDYCCHCQFDFSSVGVEEKAFLRFLADGIGDIQGWSAIPGNDLLSVLKRGVTLSYLKSKWPGQYDVMESLLDGSRQSYELDGVNPDDLKPSLEEFKNRLTILTRCPSYMIRKMPAGY